MADTTTCKKCKGTGRVPGESNAKRKIPEGAANILPGYHDEARQKTCPDCLGSGVRAA